MVRKKIPDNMGPSESAFFIEGDRSRTVSCSYLQDLEPVPVNPLHKPDHGSAVSLILNIRPDGQILDLQDPIALIGHRQPSLRPVLDSP